MGYSSAVWGATKLVAITPSDTTNLSGAARGFLVGVGGDVVAVDVYGNAVTLKNLISGVIYPIQITRINATNTTATDLVALY